MKAFAVRCIKLVLETAPRPRQRVKTFSLRTEAYRIRDCANLISAQPGVDIGCLLNWGNEANSNELRVANHIF